MNFDNLTKEQLLELLKSIKDDVEYIEKCAAESKTDYERTGYEWYKGRSDSYEQSAKWINERFDKYADKESTRP